MKKLFASVAVALVALPLVSFGCGGGDCTMDLPPPEVPIPSPVDNLVRLVTDHTGALVSLALAAILVSVAARPRKLLAAESITPLNSPSA